MAFKNPVFDFNTNTFVEGPEIAQPSSQLGLYNTTAPAEPVAAATPQPVAVKRPVLPAMENYPSSGGSIGSPLAFLNTVAAAPKTDQGLQINPVNPAADLPGAEEPVEKLAKPVDASKQTPPSAPAQLGSNTSTSIPGEMVSAGKTVTTTSAPLISSKALVDATKSAAEQDKKVAQLTSEGLQAQANEEKKLAEQRATDVAAREKLDASIQQRKQELTTEYDNAVNEYKNMAVQPKGFWAITNTGEKIGTLMSTLGATVMMMGRNPEQGQRQLENIQNKIKQTVDQDLAIQNQKIEQARNALGDKRILMAQKMQLIGDEKADTLARQQAAYDVMNDKIKAVGSKFNVDIAGLKPGQIDSKFAMDVAKLNQEVAILNSAKSVTQTTETLKPVEKPISNNDLVQQIGRMTPSERTKFQLDRAELANRMAPKGGQIDSFEAAQQLRNKMSKFIDKNGNVLPGATVAVADVIATYLKQGSFGPDLMNTMIGTSEPDKVRNFISGFLGNPKLTPAQLNNIIQYADKTITATKQDPKLMQDYQAYINVRNTNAKIGNVANMWDNGQENVTMESAKASAPVEFKSLKK